MKNERNCRKPSIVEAMESIGASMDRYVRENDMGQVNLVDSDESWQASEALLRVADSSDHQSKGGTRH